MLDPEPGRGEDRLGGKMKLLHISLPRVRSTPQDVRHVLLSGSIIDMHGRDYLCVLSLSVCAHVFMPWFSIGL